MYPTVFWGNLLRELRENHYMLQKEVASLLHISRQSYSNIEVGKTKPTPEQLATLSYVYEVNLLDYVDKCLPASYLAERYAFRADQTRKLAEILLIQEEMEKLGTDRPKEDRLPETEPGGRESAPDDRESTPDGRETENHPESQEISGSSQYYGAEKSSHETLLEMNLPKIRKRRKKNPDEDNAKALKKELLRRRNTRKKAPQFHNTSGMSDVALLKSKRHIEDVLNRGDFTGTEVSGNSPSEDAGFPSSSPESAFPDSKDAVKENKQPRKVRTAKTSSKKHPAGKTSSGKNRAAEKTPKPNSGKTNSRANTSKPKSRKNSPSGRSRKPSSGKN